MEYQISLKLGRIALFNLELSAEFPVSHCCILGYMLLRHNITNDSFVC